MDLIKRLPDAYFAFKKKHESLEFISELELWVAGRYSFGTTDLPSARVKISTQGCLPTIELIRRALASSAPWNHHWQVNTTAINIWANTGTSIPVSKLARRDLKGGIWGQLDLETNEFKPWERLPEFRYFLPDLTWFLLARPVLNDFGGWRAGE